MRLGIVTSSYPLSAVDTVTAGVFVRDLAEELVALGHEVHVLTPRKRGKVEPSPHLAVYDFPWWGGEKDLASASMRNPLTALRYLTLVLSGLWHVSRYVLAHRLEALLAMWAIPSGLFTWLTWRRHGIPYGVWVLGSDIWARHKYPWGDRIVRRVLREARFRFADGLRLSRDAEQLAGAPCEFVPSVRHLPAPATAPRLELAPGCTHFLFIGRYEYNKGPDILVEAMRLLLDQGGQAHLHMFGVGSLETQLRKRIRGYEAHIHLNGYADPSTVVAYMSACTWLVIPSRVESIPLIFSDALQMRLPIIATEVGDMGELVRRLGVGRVVASPDASILAANLRSALTVPRAEFAGVWEAGLHLFSLRQSALRCQARLATARQDRS